MNNKKTTKMGRPTIHDRPVLIIEKNAVYPNYREAAKAINGNRGCVYSCLRGDRARHLGYTFAYVDPF